MGISIVQKSNLKEPRKKPSKLALVLAGGAIAGAAFKISGLKAFNDHLINKKITDFDIYVGLSAGAILAIPLCAGIPPEEVLTILDGKSNLFQQLAPYDIYYPNWKEFILRPLKFCYGHMSFIPGIFYDVLTSSPKLKDAFLENSIEFFKNPTYSNYEQMSKPILKVAYSTRKIPTLGEILPSGIFDNTPIESFIRRNMKRNKLPNNFRVLKRVTGKSLYITAMDLDTSERVIFGADEKNDVTISEAAQASGAVPGFYKPARIKGVDYIDGGVRKTANIDLAHQKGADLIICYNPFRPYNNKIFLEYLREDNKYITNCKRLSDWGLGTVLNQVFRTLFHSRLQHGLKSYQDDPTFKKDIIVIEPKEDDSNFFEMNPMYYWNRAKAAKLGFESVKESIEEHYDQISAILAYHGIQTTKEFVEKDLTRMADSQQDDAVIMEVLEQKHNKKSGLKMLRGGRK